MPVAMVEFDLEATDGLESTLAVTLGLGVRCRLVSFEKKEKDLISPYVTTTMKIKIKWFLNCVGPLDDPVYVCVRVWNGWWPYRCKVPVLCKKKELICLGF